ncbi:hypothetical protein [Micromonospora tulbaghiae]|uniref:hypothetical protein n=1 Tax=Micromonospora tulbaghiae TaxID=479978 RepID=UPI0013C44320|nr:hypothetical protein [Micromonospora tulbaghiae]
MGAALDDGLDGRRSVWAVAGRWQPDSGPDGFLATTVEHARLVLDAEEGWPTYDAGLEFQGLAMSAMSETPAGEYLPDIPVALNLISTHR